MANIGIFYQGKTYTINNKKIRYISREILRQLGYDCFDLSVGFVSIKRIRQLNRDFRDIDEPTDILSFPLWGQGDPAGDHGDLLGEIVICLTVARRNAVGIGQGLDREVCFLLVHGILHLAGFDHQTTVEAERMFRKQRQIMASIDENYWQGCVTSKESK